MDLYINWAPPIDSESNHWFLIATVESVIDLKLFVIEFATLYELH